MQQKLSSKRFIRNKARIYLSFLSSGTFAILEAGTAIERNASLLNIRSMKRKRKPIKKQERAKTTLEWLKLIVDLLRVVTLFLKDWLL
jgi:hypothetical protein